MTSQERHEARYQRRRAKRLQRKNAKCSQLGDYEKTFSYGKLYNAFKLCKRGVRWKKSIQTYEATQMLSTLGIYRTMKNRQFKAGDFQEFDICERGKLRHIRALNIQERCIQRVLCDEYLLPLLKPKIVFDNGASIKGKGISFSLNRLKYHLASYYRKYHTNDGYIFQFDFSSYFDNIDHTILLNQLEKEIPDNEIFEVVRKMVVCFGNKGLGLGSQVSQICAIYYPTLLDRALQSLPIEGYCRYMDDGVVICKTKEIANRCKEVVLELCKTLNITPNMKKFSISKISKTFVFLKKRIFLSDTGKVVMRLGRSSITRARRRLKKLAKRVQLRASSRFTLENLAQCYLSWIGNARKLDNYWITKHFEEFYHSLVRQTVKNMIQSAH